MFDFDLRLFKLVDLGKNFFQALPVGGAKILAVGHIGNLRQRLLINIDGHPHVTFTEKWILHRIHRLAARADADRVNAHVKSLRHARRGERVDLTGVVAAIREQNNHLAFRFAVAQTIDGRGDAQPNRGAVFLDHAGLDFFEKIDQHAVIERKRALRKTPRRKHHQADAIAAPASDKLLGHQLRRFHAIVGLKIFREHAAGNIERQHDVDAFRRHLFFRVPALRPGQRDDDQR